MLQTELRRATIPIFFDMIQCEYRSKGNFMSVSLNSFTFVPSAFTCLFWNCAKLTNQGFLNLVFNIITSNANQSAQIRPSTSYWTVRKQYASRCYSTDILLIKRGRGIYNHDYSPTVTTMIQIQIQIQNFNKLSQLGFS